MSLPSYEGAGNLGDFFGAITTIFGLRNNLLNVIFGISYERALFWHKAMGGATIVVIAIHALCGMNFSGIMMLVAMVAMALTYLIKNQKIPKAFEIFYYCHLAAMILLMVMGLSHGTPFIMFSGLLWIVDVILRSCAYCQSETIKATVTHLPGEVIKLTFEKAIKYHAGQYAFLRIPTVNKIEFHPFSFSSSPQDDQMTIHIRELGDWTRRLGDIVREHDKSSPNTPLQLDVMVDGSYGSHMINLESPEYEVFLLISGGIGITPNQSVYNRLIAQSESGRVLRKVFFIWSVKDKALVDTMSPDMLESSKLHPELTPLSFQPAMTGQATKHIKSSSVMPVTSIEEGIELANPSTESPGEAVFENRFYLTRLRSESEFQNANIDPTAQPWLYFGRPDVPALFEETRAMLLKDREGGRGGGGGVSRVAVSVCGPRW